MSNNLILQEKYDTLKEGYPVYINQDDIRAFTVLNTSNGVSFGSLLALTGTTKVYEAAENLVSGTITDANSIIGVALAPNVKLNTVYPGGFGTNIGLQGGDQGDNMSKGEVAVQYFGSVPDENDPVYLITANGDQPVAQLGRVSADSTSVGTEVKLLLPQFRFAGVNDDANALTVLRKLTW
jgi:hypothetical protein